MRVTLARATKAQLAAFLAAEYAIETHPDAAVKALKAKLDDLGWTETYIEVPDDLPADEPETVAAPGDAGGLVAALIADGKSAAEAEAIARDVAMISARRSLAPGEKPYGPGKEDMYVTVHIARAPGRDGGRDVEVGVNGSVQYVPRGVDWPLRTPFLEVLEHSVEMNYEQVWTSPTDPPILVGTEVMVYPTECRSAPYGRDEALEVAARAREVLLRRGDPRAFESAERQVA